MLICAIGPKQVGGTHAGQAKVMTIFRRAGWIVGRQVVKNGPDSRFVQIVPEGDPLSTQQRQGRFVVERPEIELQFVIPCFPVAFTCDGFRR